jgi:hypothetical protein
MAFRELFYITKYFHVHWNGIMYSTPRHGAITIVSNMNYR